MPVFLLSFFCGETFKWLSFKQTSLHIKIRGRGNLRFGDDVVTFISEERYRERVIFT